MVGSATELAEGLAARVASESRPQSPQLHLVPTGLGSTLAFVPNGSRIHALSGQMAEQFAVLLREGDRVAIERAMIEYGLHAPPTIDDEPLHNPTLHAISLAVAQKCNMGCSYCYADQGDFGGPAQNMQLETAKRSIDLLLGGLEAGARAQVTFLGGEPLLNRNTLRAATEYASQRAAERIVI